MSSLHCEIVEVPRAVVMKLTGQMTYAEMEEFEKQSGRATSSKPNLLVLDFSELDVMTSAGIGALLKLERKMRDHKCPVCIAAAQPKIAEIFRLARLDSIFKIMPTVSEAMN